METPRELLFKIRNLSNGSRRKRTLNIVHVLSALELGPTTLRSSAQSPTGFGTTTTTTTTTKSSLSLTGYNMTDRWALLTGQSPEWTPGAHPSGHALHRQARMWSTSMFT